jgi:hypothetical protein
MQIKKKKKTAAIPTEPTSLMILMTFYQKTLNGCQIFFYLYKTNSVMSLTVLAEGFGTI